mmetsp:Transcript_14029/g.25969  ORF Transcript_14029/g.25969 Transcript_14029/m.25969 type:complete len:524 (-) Transcript_14029:61-1632(-)
MAKKKASSAQSGGAGQAPGAAATAEATLRRGEELIDTDPRAAVQCFEEVLQANPKNQSAWCNRGVAAAQLWEEAGSRDRGPLLQMACESFRQVFSLDTSTRSEARYLSALACGKLLLRAAGVLEETQTNGMAGSGAVSGELIEALAEASRCFEEAFRLTQDWGHEAFDDECWGAWGEVLAHQMRVEIAAVELRLPRSDASLAEGVCCAALGETLNLEGIARLCEAAADKFGHATRAEVPEKDVMDAGDDARWLTLHAEHLLAFVDFVKKAASIPPTIELPLEALGSKAEAAWQEAVNLADASLQLLGTDAGWEAFSLRGDVFAAATELLGALSSRMANPQLRLPTREASAPELSEAWESVGMPSYTAGQLINAAGAATYAEAAYAEALGRGGQEAVATVNLSLGELRLGRARRLPSEGMSMEVSSGGSCSEREACLRAASDAFQKVTASQGADREDKASAWYNLACVAGLLGKAEHAAQALQLCFKNVRPSSHVQHWAREAKEDKDFELVCSHPDVQQVLAGR